MDKKAVFRVAGVYIGTVVGAGFASGQEVLQFFGHLGLGGFAGLLLTTALFIVFGHLILRLSYELQASSYLPVIRAVAGPKLSLVLDGIITFFLFGALTAMSAGAGAIFFEQFGLAKILGSIIMAAAAVITVLLGLNRVITAISLVAPFLLAAVLSVSVYTIWQNGGLAGLAWTNAARAPVPYWPLSAVVYASFNLVMALPVLAPLATTVKEPGNLRMGAIFGGAGLGLGALAVNAALLANLPRAATFEIPMLHIATGLGTLFRTLYGGVLLLEIYTTAVGNLYGFSVRVTSPQSANFRAVAVITGIVALIAAQLGFSTLVRVVYSAVGFAGLLLLGALTYGYFKSGRLAPARFQPGHAQAKLLPQERPPQAKAPHRRDDGP